MRSFLGAPVQALGKVFGNIYLAEKRGGGGFSPQDERSLQILATQAGVAVANASLYQESVRRERWLEALRQITVDILEGAEPDSLLTSIAEHARELAGGDAASILTTTSTPGMLEVAASVGAHAQRVRGQGVPTAGSISGEVIKTGKPVNTADAGTHRRGYQPVIRMGEVGPAIFVPLRVRGRASKVGGRLTKARSDWSRPLRTRPRWPSSTRGPRRTCAVLA
jgi:GAF domain-containing protein